MDYLNYLSFFAIDDSDDVKGCPSLQELMIISKDGSSVQDGQLLPSITELEGRSTRSPFP
uniref:Uncharacterized protein n=1 Tax=Oryza barthii TaxID=65489 RepID=A0A0D3G9A7_9ORYZ